MTPSRTPDNLGADAASTEDDAEDSRGAPVESSTRRPGREVRSSLADAVERLAQADGVFLIIGATDTGKTTFCAEVVRAAGAKGRAVAVVDADTGQSEIGPPTTLGLGIADREIARLSDLRPRGLWFIGSTSPPGFLMEWAIGTRALVDRAKSLSAPLILVDTPGMVQGPMGARLQLGLAAAIHPDSCVLMEREGELQTIERGLPPCLRLWPELSTAIHAKTPTVRSLRRVANYARYFEDAREWELPVDRGIVRGSALFTGRPVRPAALATLQQKVRTRLLHIERNEDGVRVIAAGPLSPEETIALSERFRAPVRALESSRLAGTALGLLNAEGETAALGILKRVDYRRRRLRVVSPWLEPDALSGFVWGVARVKPTGEELPPHRRGDL